MKQQKLLVCICDDDPVLLRELERICSGALADYDAGILTATDSGQLLENAVMCDIAVLDIRMPETDGMALSLRLREQSPYCQIIFVSSFVGYVSEVYDVPHLYLILRDQLETQLPRFLHRAAESLGASEKSALDIGCRGQAVRVLPSQLCYLERRGHTTLIKLRSGETISTQTKLDRIMAQADPSLICPLSCELRGVPGQRPHMDPLGLRDGGRGHGPHQPQLSKLRQGLLFQIFIRPVNERGCKKTASQKKNDCDLKRGSSRSGFVV